MSTELGCGEASAVLAGWDPEGDLEERVAAHVGTCPACRAVFDARFPPAVARAVAVPRVGRRVPANERWTRIAALAAVALAAAGVTAGGLWSGGAEARDDLLPPECPIELVAVAMECPAG